MNAVNELLQAAQTASTARKYQPGNTDSDGDSKFDQMLKDRTQSTGDTAKTPNAAESENPQDETLQEVAAALTMLAGQVPLNQQIQTGELPAPQMQLETTETAQTQLPAALVQTEAGKPLAELPKTENGQRSAIEKADGVQVQESGAEIRQTAAQATVQSQRSGTAEDDAGQTGADTSSDGNETAHVENTGADAPQPLFRNVAAVPVKVGETPVADTAQPEFDSQLAKQIDSALTDGARQVKIQLTPENLGTLTIDLTQSQDGALQVVLHTTTDKAAELLTRHADSLGALLQNSAQGAVQVEVQRQEESQQFQQFQQFQQQSQQQNQPQQQRHGHTQSGEDFLQQLRLGLVSLDEEQVS